MRTTRSIVAAGIAVAVVALAACVPPPATPPAATAPVPVVPPRHEPRIVDAFWKGHCWVLGPGGESNTGDARFVRPAAGGGEEELIVTGPYGATRFVWIAVLDDGTQHEMHFDLPDGGAGEWQQSGTLTHHPQFGDFPAGTELSFAASHLGDRGINCSTRLIKNGR